MEAAGLGVPPGTFIGAVFSRRGKCATGICWHLHKTIPHRMVCLAAFLHAPIHHVYLKIGTMADDVRFAGWRWAMAAGDGARSLPNSRCL